MAIKFYDRLQLIDVLKQLDTKLPIPKENLPTTHVKEGSESIGNTVYTFKLTTRKNSARQKLYSMETCIIH